MVKAKKIKETELTQLGKKIATTRLYLGYTQEELATQANIGKRTLERIENGEASQTSNILKILKVLHLDQNFLEIFPEPEISPMAYLHGKRKLPQRVRKTTTAQEVAEPTWKWGDET